MKRERIGKQTILTTWSAMGLLLAMAAFRQFAWPSISAETRTRAVSSLTPPYFRLSESPIQTEPGKVILDIKVNTGGLETMEADILLEYNPYTLVFKQDETQIPSCYSVHQITQPAEGKIDLVFFNLPQTNEMTFKTDKNEEARLTSLVFEIINPEAQMTQMKIRFLPNKLDESNLILAYERRPETPTDILNSVEGTKIRL